MNALLWLPQGSHPQTGPVLRGNILRFLSCSACNWPLMNPCPMCVQNPIPEVLDLARLCPIMISDDGVNFHRHCLKANIWMSAVRTQDGVIIGYVPGGISFPMPYLTVAPPYGEIMPQGLLQQRPVHQGVIQQDLNQGLELAGPSPQPQPDSTQENWADTPQYSYGSLCDCSDFEQD
uniref:Uncharacterized protein n=1 Tax=Anopheles atroparvus TaxID=41427 RepID=A0A182IS48_ANOAO